MPARAYLHLALLLAAANLALPLEKWHPHPDGPAGARNCSLCLNAANLVADQPDPPVVPALDVLWSVSVPAGDALASLALAPARARGPPAPHLKHTLFRSSIQ